MKLKDMPPELAERRRDVIRKYNAKPERKAYMRAWYEKNKDRHQELGKKWRDDNHEYHLALHRDGYRRNRKIRLERSRVAYHRDKLEPKLIAKSLWGGAKRRARNEGLEFTLTKEWVMRLVVGGVCEVSGIRFEPGNGIHHPLSPSIDRIDRGYGYTEENSRLVIWAVNNLKGTGDDNTMWKVVEAMISNRNKRGQE